MIGSTTRYVLSLRRFMSSAFYSIIDLLTKRRDDEGGYADFDWS